MGIRDEAPLHAQAFLESASDFGWPFTLTSPAGVVSQLRGYTTDVGQTIDPETGQAVAGRRASVACSLLSLAAMPEAIADSTSKPWVATFADVEGVTSSWKVVEVLPDRAAGVIVLIVEIYHAGSDT